MIRYRQYRPAYFSGFESQEGEVATVEELLKIAFIANFEHVGRSNLARFHGFHRYSIGSFVETPQGRLTTLMAEYDEGREWWVVAYLWPQSDQELAPLPQWAPKEKRVTPEES